MTLPLAPEQLTLIRLMQRCHYVAEWRHLFQGAMILAKTDRGCVATVRLDDIESLLAAGLIDRGYGGSFHLTDAGKAF